MRIKRKNGLKVAAITIALLLCLALAVGITGAWYQAKRQATGTLSMDQGIIIDYNGFDKTGDEWSKWERTATLPLFSITNAQPGQNIPVNPAGIRANEKSVNFYARLKLDYKFYNVVKSATEGGQEQETKTPVELADATKLIKTSSSFFGTNWVDGGSSDGYYYYATGSTLNKFEKGAAATFVNLFATDAKFIIEGAGFTGADNNGESGGFKIDETTSINKIEVYLTLETLQGDVQADELNTMGWKIASQVKFAEATGKMETSVNKTATTEDLNVSVAGATEVPINEVVFPYDTDTTLKFDSNNVEYVILTYEDGSSDTFEEVAEKTISVKADSSKGKVTGYIVGLFNSEEYTGFTYATEGYEDSIDFKKGSRKYTVSNGLVVTGYYGTGNIIIPDSLKVRERDFKVEFKEDALDMFMLGLYRATYPIKFTFEYDNVVENEYTFNNFDDAYRTLLYDGSERAEFNKKLSSLADRTKGLIIISYKALIPTDSIFYSFKTVKEIGSMAFAMSECSEVTLPAHLEKLRSQCFTFCSNLESITLPDSVNYVGFCAFAECTNLTKIKLSDNIETIGSNALETGAENCVINIPNNLKYLQEGFFLNELSKFTQNENFIITTEENVKYLGNSTNPYMIMLGVTDENVTSITINERTKCIYFGIVDDSGNIMGTSNVLKITNLIIPDSVTSIQMGISVDKMILTGKWVEQFTGIEIYPNSEISGIPSWWSFSDYSIKRA